MSAQKKGVNHDQHLERKLAAQSKEIELLEVRMRELESGDLKYQEVVRRTFLEIMEMELNISSEINKEMQRFKLGGSKSSKQLDTKWDDLYCRWRTHNHGSLELKFYLPMSH